MKNQSILKQVILIVFLLTTTKMYAQTYSVAVGETITLDVPSVSIGYVDKAIWACPNPSIKFVEKSTFSATIKVVAAFEGHATVELVYVEKYYNNKGHTRQNTYTKNFYISCKGGGSNPGNSSIRSTKISVQPELKIPLGERGRIYYTLYPEGSSVDLWSNTSNCDYFKSASFHKDQGYLEGIGSRTGIETVKIYFYKNENDTDWDAETVSGECKVTVYDPTWTEPQSVSLQNVLLLNVGDNDKKVYPIFTPANANALYDWTSDNSDVAYKAWTGCFVGKSVGIANMRLVTSNNLSAQCTVIVLPKDTKIPGLRKGLERAAEMLHTTEYEIIK